MSTLSRISGRKELPDLAVGARDRLKTGAPALLLFTACGALAQPSFWTTWWWYVGLAIVLSAVLLEPFFNSPRASLANSAAAVGAFWSANRADLAALWGLFLALSLIVFFAAIVVVLVGRDSVVKQNFQRIARLGRATYLGISALMLETASQLVRGSDQFVWLGIGSVILIVGVNLTWSRLRGRSAPEGEVEATDAIGPRLLLLSGIENLPVGSAVSIDGAQNVEGVVAGHLPGERGTKTMVATHADWSNVAAKFPRRIKLRSSATTAIVGIASAGTTPKSIVFTPYSDLNVGQTVSVPALSGTDLLYQVQSMKLVDSIWSGSKAVTPQAVAHQLGQVEGGQLRLTSWLPAAHAPVSIAKMNAAYTLPLTHVRLGVLSGTTFPIGFATDAAVRGHLAVLGMSGMGKTSVVARICDALGKEQVVVALDATGEYVSKLGVPGFVAGDLTTTGFRVKEPTGNLASEAEKFISEFMTQGNAEYREGVPKPRVLCLEEAHGFVPEWNFTTRPEADKSALSARYIMQARKFGLSFLLVSQRTAVVSKSALSQCESYIVFRTLDDTSLSYLEGIIGGVAREVVPTLARHEALCFGPAFNSESPIVVRMDAPALKT